MNKTAIVVCGNSGIDYLGEFKDVFVLRSILNLGDKEYEDFIDIKAEEFYDIIAKDPDINLSTSQTPVGKIREMFENIKNLGYKMSPNLDASVLLQTGYMFSIVENFSISALGEIGYSYDSFSVYKKENDISNIISFFTHNIQLGILSKFNIKQYSIGIGGGMKFPMYVNYLVKNNIIEYAKKNIVKYALPKEYEYVDNLPKTPIGKVDYKKFEKK